MRIPVFCLALLVAAGPVWADEAPKAEKVHQVPYRLTDTNHVLVRAKINGKGPYHFILDTGAPALYVSTAACKKAGVKADARGWGTFDRFEIEGGVVVEKARGRVEDPFQLEGMNGLGLAGVELHGVIGYNLLAKFRIRVDFTKDKMTWARLNFNPPPPQALGGKGAPAAGLEAIGGIMKFVGTVLGKQTEIELKPRGFLGVELAEEKGAVVVAVVLAKSPAEAAGVKVGDRITQFQDKKVENAVHLHRLAGKVAAGETVRLAVVRKGQPHEVAVKLGKGL